MKRLKLFVIAMLACSVAFAQTKVTGKVTSSADGTPIPFANVVVKGTMTGVASLDDGTYVLENVPKNAVLVFSSIGFVSQEIALNGRSVVNAALAPDTNALEEVMVVAYGTAKKGTYTGSASVVKSDAIKDVPTVAFEQALNGKVAGLQVTTTSGQAGSSSSIRIRGIGSMNASNEPLYVIDGVPAMSGSSGQMGDYIYTSNNVMATLNPSDIASVTVLKDAAASALYGSRAANGVIVVTTKRGKEGKPTVSFKASVGLTPTWATDNYETASPQENVNMLYMVFHDYRTSNGKSEADANAYALRQLNNKWNQFGYDFTTNGTGLYDNVNIKGRTDGIENHDGIYFDWDDAYFRTAVYQTYDLSVSGGTDKTNYYTSLSYTKEQGRVYVNEFDRISGRVNVSQKVGKYIDFTTNVNIANTDKSGFNDTRSTTGNYFMQVRNLLWPVYWPTDYKTGDPWTARYASLAQNMLYYNDLWDNSSKTLKLSVSETLGIKFTDYLNLRSIFSYDDTRVRDHIYYSAEHFSGSSVNGSVTEMTTEYTKMVSSTTLNFNKEFGKHNVSALVGFEAERNNTDFMRASGEDLPVSALHTVATAGVLDANAYYWGNSMVSILSRAEYNYNNKYYVSGSYRRDGSSRLGEVSRWGNFWSVAGSWRISNEDFMQNQDIISNLRLRASYGVNGTLPSSNYGWRSLTSYSSKYMESPGGALSNAADAELSWETNYTSNLALEFGLFDNRLSGTVEYFNRDSKDLLQDVPISYITGFSSTLQNVGEINNHGFEIEIAGDIIKNSSFRWSAGINASILKSTVTKLYDGQDIIWADPTGGDSRAYYIYREGESTLAFWGREWAGVDSKNGANIWYSNNNNSDFTMDGRNVVYDLNDADEVIIGNAIPKMFGGFNTDIEWKGITLGLNFTYKIGGDLMDGASRDIADDGYYWNRIRGQYYYDNMWTESNPNGTQPKLRGTDLEDSMERSSRHLWNASYLRLKTISVGYSIPTNLVKKAGLSAARVYFNGSNLWTISKYKIADPEVNQYGTRGWETPIGKTYTFGVELSF
ncbi:MAG: TonB-dependent receptor [Bacteroidales bacterium]|nr:TonB-dependent receptor [Bacteroidales bacterium]MDD4669583.1 TonB-dependent receptor [Bacteroidales bacterium]